jgi:hypothetical protein
MEMDLNMITIVSATIGETSYTITFSKLKYQFMVDKEVVFEDRDYSVVREAFGGATGF